MGVNLLYELDTINEYFLDTINNIVYISKLRQNTISQDNYVISVNPFIISLYGTDDKKEFDPLYSIRNIRKPIHDYNNNQPYFAAEPQLKYITIQNLTMQYATQSAIYATNVANITISNIKKINMEPIARDPRTTEPKSTVHYVCLRPDIPIQ